MISGGREVRERAVACRQRKEEDEKAEKTVGQVETEHNEVEEKEESSWFQLFCISSSQRRSRLGAVFVRVDRKEFFG